MHRLLLGGGGHRPQERRVAPISEIKNLLGPNVDRVLFIPFALQDYDKYVKTMIELGFDAGYDFESIHECKNPKEAVVRAQAIFVGGGNTFRLLYTLERRGLIEVIQAQVRGGVPYIGVSAGSNVACPTIKTTNDMPIVEPRRFDALNLVPFQINPHYLDPDPNSAHQGETREERIREFHEMNETTVVGLREGAILRIENGSVRLCGTTGARIFKRWYDPVEYVPGNRLDFLLQ